MFRQPATLQIEGDTPCVSIPFERESVFRLDIVNCILGRYKFQFPSSGKVCSDLPGGEVAIEVEISFQFPSSGKVCSDYNCEHGEYWFTIYGVSIPFERESVFRLSANAIIEEGAIVFQFPSSGKVCSDMLHEVLTAFCNGFNSLRAGKCVQTVRHRS